MKIFYGIAINNDSHLNKLVTEIIPHYLRSQGHVVTIYGYSSQSTENIPHSFDTLVKQIGKADVYIGEMSKASQSLGFQLSFALNNQKPSLYLYHASRLGQPDRFVTENPSRLLRVKTYDDHDYKRVLDQFFRSAFSQLASKRTSFMSTDRIDNYITNKSAKLGISKGELIRQILDRESQY